MVLQTSSALCWSSVASSSSSCTVCALCTSPLCSPVAASSRKCKSSSGRYGGSYGSLSAEFLGEQCCLATRISASEQVSIRDFSVSASSQTPNDDGGPNNSLTKALQTCALCLAVAITIALPLSPIPPTIALEGDAAMDTSDLIASPPIQDANVLLRNALPIHNKPIKEVQKSLEAITDDLMVPAEEAIGSVERNIRQAAGVLHQSKDAILADVAETKKEEGQQMLDKLTEGFQDFYNIIEEKDTAAVAPKQKELLRIVGYVEEAMVDKFPFEVPEQFADKPLLKGRATLEMKVTVKDNPNIKSALLEIVVDGYNAPVTAGNFVDLVERHFYDGMEIQRADGSVVQTGDPDGPVEGFVDPSTGKIRTIPLEIMVDGDKEPIYSATLEELGRYKAQTKLPFNAVGTVAMARNESEKDSASSLFWLLKESELMPNILDGHYAVFGYVTENKDILADLKVGDVIESIRVTNGLQNLANPSYKII